MCGRVDSDGNSLLQERYMRPRDFRDRNSDNRELIFNSNSRLQGGTSRVPRAAGATSSARGHRGLVNGTGAACITPRALSWRVAPDP